MDNKLKIGDKIKWNVLIGGDTIYTILDIDASRPPTRIGGYEFQNQFLFERKDIDGETVSLWDHSYESLNNLLNSGDITIVGRGISPCRHLPTLKL